MVATDPDTRGSAVAAPEDVEIQDDADGSVAAVRYEITSFGVDFDVEGLCLRLDRGEIIIPDFQRNFAWSLRHASRFIESLLLGLPVPGIFLSRDFDSDKYVVIDGQQRLKSLQFFRSGMFESEGRPQRVFALAGVQQEFNGLTYMELDPFHRFRIDNSLIHATVVRQDAPAADNTSVYHIFDRINSGSLRLSAQEMRSAICHGKLIDELGRLNQHPSWRSIFGRMHSMRRDQELILRFLAFFFDETAYQAPMSEFLTLFSQRNRNPQDAFLEEARDTFSRTMDAFATSMGARAFRLDRALNAAMFDSMSVGLARRIVSSGRAPDPGQTRLVHGSLVEDGEYLEAVSRATGDERSISMRMTRAAERFASL